MPKGSVAESLIHAGFVDAISTCEDGNEASLRLSNALVWVITEEEKFAAAKKVGKGRGRREDIIETKDWSKILEFLK